MSLTLTWSLSGFGREMLIWMQLPHPVRESFGGPILACHKKKTISSNFCFIMNLSPITGFITIIYNSKDHCYDERRSLESWSSSLTSLPAENNEGTGTLKVLRQSVEKHNTLLSEQTRNSSNGRSCHVMPMF